MLRRQLNSVSRPDAGQLSARARVNESELRGKLLQCQLMLQAPVRAPFDPASHTLAPPAHPHSCQASQHRAALSPLEEQPATRYSLDAAPVNGALHDMALATTALRSRVTDSRSALRRRDAPATPSRRFDLRLSETVPSSL